MEGKLFRNLTAVLLMVVLVLGLTPAVQAAAGPPAYQLQFLGNGSPTAMNNAGTVVGARLSGNNYTPLVSRGGAAWEVLPVPAGAVSVFPTDVNDSGVAVGVAYNAQNYAVGVRWMDQGSGYGVEVLPRLAGDTTSYPTAINNLGQIVGARGALGYQPAMTTGWLYSDELGVVDLNATYGWPLAPIGINDNGKLIVSTGLYDLNTGAEEPLPAGPSNYNAVAAVDINNNGWIAGDASLRSSSLNIISVFRLEGAAGWRFIAGSSRYTRATGINILGDVAYSEQGAGLYLDGLGTYALGSLLDAAYSQAGWAITGSGAEINDQRAVATLARNSQTNQSGGVLLTPIGQLPAPSAPANLSGVAHTATRMEPYNSINLTWENTSTLTRTYELERRETGGSVWTALALTPPAMATNHTDTTVAVGVTYDYRVRAVGVAGPGPWSNIISVRAPTTPLDTTAPTVSILTPANNAAVSGTVTVTAQASDNVAVEYLEIKFWNQYLGQDVILGSVSNSGSLTVNWDTRSLTPAAYTLSAYAYDPMGNWKQVDITVNVSAAARSLKVSSIALNGSVSGSRANITGDVFVKDASGRSVSNATVAIRWTLPNGTTRTATAVTNLSGRARFTISGTRGTYTLTVTNVSRSGYVFDAAGSVLTRSITR